MYYVYKITNTKNKKVYIGQTQKEIEKRFEKHWMSRNEKDFYYLPLRKALRESDKNDWKIEILEFTKDKELANIYEKKYIKLYNSTNEGNGYNVSLGGIGGDTLTNNKNLKEICNKISKKLTGKNNAQSKSVKIYNKKISLIFESASLCCKFLNEMNIKINVSSIKRKCNGKIKNNKIDDFYVCWNK